MLNHSLSPRNNRRPTHYITTATPTINTLHCRIDSTSSHSMNKSAFFSNQQHGNGNAMAMPWQQCNNLGIMTQRSTHKSSTCTQLHTSTHNYYTSSTKGDFVLLSLSVTPTPSSHFWFMGSVVLELEIGCCRVRWKLRLA